MNIIMTTHYSPWSPYYGGGQHSTHNLASALAGRGHDVSVVYTKPPWETIATPSDLPYTIRWAVLPSIRSRRRSLFRPFASAFVARAVQELLKPSSIVHANGEEASLLPRLRRRHRFAFVLTPRYPSYPLELLRSAPTVRNQARLWLFENKFRQLSAAVEDADLICPTSRSAARQIQQAYGVAAERIRVVSNGVSEVFCSVRRPNDAPSGPIVFFGRLDRSKGADVLLQALARIESAARSCVIIGRGEQSDALHRIADELGIRSSVMIKDWMVPADLARVLGRASMAVLPSREESFGNAIAEAMATGAPVISTTAGSVPELITDGENGLLVPPDDPIALAAAIQKLQHDPVYAAAMGENARRTILERFTWSRVARTFEGIYNELSQA